MPEQLPIKQKKVQALEYLAKLLPILTEDLFINGECFMNFGKQTTNHGGDAQRLLVFTLGSEHFGLLLLKVKEVLGRAKITPVPRSPIYFKGMMDLRGQVVAVIDLRERLQTKKPENEESAIMIIELNGSPMGVIVDKIDSVIPINIDDIQKTPEISTDIDPNFISGIYHGKDQLVMIIDIERVLTSEDLKMIAAKAKKAA
jgi:purine-binding chemotaxis protein CheW